MEENFTRLIVDLIGDPLIESSCYTPNYEDQASNTSFVNPLELPAYASNRSSETVLQSYVSENTVANGAKGNSPYNSPNLSTEESENENDPFSYHCRIPVPSLMPMSRYHMWLETSFMCRRNERERQRVRNVNDGFSRLRNHLPRTANMRRRQSKVETLQHAIKYIKYLQSLLEKEDDHQSGR